MTQAQSVFRPTREPARTLHDAFQAEAQLRGERSCSEWIEKERLAVFNAAHKYAELHSLRRPTLEDVIEAETYAMGSTDYGATWAHQLERYMPVLAPSP